MRCVVGKLWVYTDGSYRDGVYAGAYVAYEGVICIHHDSGCGVKAACMNNVAGELSAVMHATKWVVSNYHSATIVYDYTGIEKWVTGEWKCKNKYTQAYRNFMKKYVDEGIITFKWVKGHNGDLGNEIADRHAKAALNAKKEWGS